MPQSSNTSQENRDEWTGYQWNTPLDEVIDCDSAPQCCRKCYYKHKGMSKKKKFAIIMFFIAVTIFLTALVIRLSLGDVDIIMGAGNQRPLTNDDANFAPLLCSEYRLTNIAMARNPVSGTITDSPPVTSSTPPSLSSAFTTSSVDRTVFDGYLLLTMPYRSYRTRTFKREEKLVFPSEGFFNYWALYLDSGSSVSVSVNPPSETEIDLRTVKGKEKLDHLLRTREVDGPVDYRFTPVDEPTSPSTERNTFNFYPSSTPDDYAFVFTILETGNASVANVSLSFLFTIHLKELAFDDGAVYDSCTNAISCSLSVPNSASAVLVEVNKTSVVWPISLRTECIPDIGMYCVFFVGIPIGCVVFFLSCAGVLYLCQESVMRDVERADRARAMNAQSSSPPTRAPSRGDRGSSTMSRTATSRHAFRIATSPRARLVDNDDLDAPPRYDSPPPYQVVANVSSPVPQVASVNDISLSVHDQDDPPPYHSITT